MQKTPLLTLWQDSQEYATLGHSVDPEEIEDLQAWLEGVLPPL